MEQIPFAEQETVITFSPKQVSEKGEIYTCMPNIMKKLRELAKERPDCVRIKKDLGNALFAEMDRSCVKISPKRIVPEEQRTAAAERLRKWRSDQ